MEKNLIGTEEKEKMIFYLQTFNFLIKLYYSDGNNITKN